MLPKGLSFSIIIYLLLVIVVCISMDMATKPANLGSGQLPRRTVYVTVETSEQQTFFDQLQKFAEKHGFTLLIDAMPSGDKDFLIYMTRTDFIISGTNPFAAEEYKLGLYDIDSQNPGPDSIIDELISDLERFVSEVPGALFTVDK